MILCVTVTDVNLAVTHILVWSNQEILHEQYTYRYSVSFWYVEYNPDIFRYCTSSVYLVSKLLYCLA